MTFGDLVQRWCYFEEIGCLIHNKRGLVKRGICETCVCLIKVHKHLSSLSTRASNVTIAYMASNVGRLVYIAIGTGSDKTIEENELSII